MKKSSTIIFIVFLAILFFTTTNSFALRCGNDMVSEGDSKTRVQITCGKPTTKIKQSRKYHNKIEEWHYNCGDNDFIYKLTFENGILTNETTEGRGKGKSECRGR
jgi:hypothetical protein